MTHRGEYDKAGAEPTIYRARRIRDGAIVYVAATYEPGRYTRQLTPREQRLNGAIAEFGSFSYIRGHTESEQYARRRAVRVYGYGHIADAEKNLGEEYEPC